MNPLSKSWYIHFDISEALSEDKPERYTIVREPGDCTYELKNIKPLGNSLFLAQETIWRPSGGNYGVFNDDGTVIVPFIYKHIEYSPEKELLICEDKTYGIHGELVVLLGDEAIHLPPRYDDAHECFSEGLLAVHRYWSIELENNDSHYIDELGCVIEELVDGELPRETWFNGWGFIDMSGNEVIGCNKNFYRVGDFHDGMAWVKEPVEGLGHELGESIGYINKTGVLVCEAHDNYLGDFNEGIAIAGVGTPGNWESKLHFIDKDGNSIIGTGLCNATPFENGLSTITFSYYNHIKKEYLVNINGRIKLASKDGDVWIPIDLFQYNYFGDFCDGFSVIGRGSHNQYSYGIMDKDGKIVVPVIYSRIDSFCEQKAFFQYKVSHYIISRVGSPFNESVDYNTSGYNVFEGHFDRDLRIHTIVHGVSITLPEGSLYSFDLPRPLIAVRTKDGFGLYNVSKSSLVLPCIYDIVDYNGEQIWAKKGEHELLFGEDDPIEIQS